jgi:transcriptional regulator NrdR family protein
MANKQNSMICPSCGGNLISCTDSRPTEFNGERAIRRRRECDTCGSRQTTYELSEDAVNRLQKVAIRQLLRTVPELSHIIAQAVLEGRIK